MKGIKFNKPARIRKNEHNKTRNSIDDGVKFYLHLVTKKAITYDRSSTSNHCERDCTPVKLKAFYMAGFADWIKCMGEKRYRENKRMRKTKDNCRRMEMLYHVKGRIDCQENENYRSDSM
mmetsp:Transcript_2138/g.2744  ORF Transcript_2138/g.2744 Transcript_2138/m.2744 type:complete len:120 (+) Transcript_2138:1255-1614(+)